MIEHENWDEIIKSHQYSRKEFKNGEWRYYYDKHNNFSKLQQCTTPTLKVSSKMKSKDIVSVAKKYLDSWIKDWKENPDKAICKELKGKKISFERISHIHLEKTGTSGNNKDRSTQNLKNHVSYLPNAKEILENIGLKTQSRYKEYTNPQKDNAIGLVYQTITGLAPKDDKNKYVQVTVSQKKYKDGSLGDTVYISVVGTKDIKKGFNPMCPRGYTVTKTVKGGDSQSLSTSRPHSARHHPSQPDKSLSDNILPQNANLVKQKNKHLLNKSIQINITDITVGNKQAKYDELAKCLNGEAVQKIKADNTKKLNDITLLIKPFTKDKIEKALRTMAFSFDIPYKAKGEVFLYKAQEELTEKWWEFYAQFVRNAYNFVIEYFDLPELTIMSKAENLTHKGKILYYPETGEPIKKKDWDKFVDNLEKFFNRNNKGTGDRIILDAKALAKILNRMLKTNTLDEVKKTKLKDIKYKGKTFDWISDNTKNMKNVLGESLTRKEMARIEVISQSATEKITRVTESLRSDIKQILIDGVKEKKSKGQISQRLFDKMVGHNRDYQRIADTELQNTFNNSFLLEEVYNTEDESEKVYFERLEIVDDNTCEYCKKMNGKIVLWSKKPLLSEKIKDEYADIAIWDGKDWDSGRKEKILCTGVLHPYCRGTWTRWIPGDVKLSSLINKNKI